MKHHSEPNYGNREYRSDVFSMLMSIPEHALSVYNALNETHYTDPSLLEIMRLEKGIYLSIRNDASFLLDSYLNLYEHQSTICPNMPLRCLIYVVNLYDKIVIHRDLFGSSLVKIPTPRFVIFYNGKQEQPDQAVLRLSDAFIKATNDPQLELTCKLININHGHSQEFLRGCQILSEYSIFVDTVHRKETRALTTNEHYLDDKKFRSIVEEAIDECISNHILEEFLLENRNEVLRVTTLDYSFERRMKLNIEEAKAQGIAEGKEEGRAEGKVQGANLLAEALTELKKNKPKAELLAAGIPEDIIELALSLLK